MSDEVVDKIYEPLPLLIYEKPNNEFDDNYYIRRLNEQICLDSWVSVVSEAHCGDGDETMFLSEKLYKPIACRHPWMVMGNKDSLAMMKKMGYKTFSEFLDEDYDSLPTHERMKAIIESVKKTISVKNKMEWFKSMREVVEHNHSNLINKLYRLPDSFVEFQKYHNQYFNIKQNLI
jgi:L-rhamnose mutarotase